MIESLPYSAIRIIAVLGFRVLLILVSSLQGKFLACDDWRRGRGFRVCFTAYWTSCRYISHCAKKNHFVFTHHSLCRSISDNMSVLGQFSFCRSCMNSSMLRRGFGRLSIVVYSASTCQHGCRLSSLYKMHTLPTPLLPSVAEVLVLSPLLEEFPAGDP
jgi:hypothetical protein